MPISRLQAGTVEVVNDLEIPSMKVVGKNIFLEFTTIDQEKFKNATLESATLIQQFPDVRIATITVIPACD
jgi:hypothetical protein